MSVNCCLLVTQNGGHDSAGCPLMWSCLTSWPPRHPAGRAIPPFTYSELYCNSFNVTLVSFELLFIALFRRQSGWGRGRLVPINILYEYCLWPYDVFNLRIKYVLRLKSFQPFHVIHVIRYRVRFNNTRKYDTIASSDKSLTTAVCFLLAH